MFKKTEKKGIWSYSSDMMEVVRKEEIATVLNPLLKRRLQDACQPVLTK